jgi:hypothetical protein
MGLKLERVSSGQQAKPKRLKVVDWRISVLVAFQIY